MARRATDATMNAAEEDENHSNGRHGNQNVENRQEEISLRNKREITVRKRKIKNKQRDKRNERTVGDGTHMRINNDGDTDCIVRSQLRLRGQHETGVLSKKRGMGE